MVAAGVGSLLMLALGVLSSFSGRSFASMSNYVELDQRSRMALDTMSRDIRQARQLNNYSTNSLTLADPDGAAISYTFDPVARSLTRTTPVGGQTLLTGCDYFEVGIFQRSPVGGNFEQFPAADATTCKLIQFKWTCSRKVLGSRINTESVQSAKIFIRNK